VVRAAVMGILVLLARELGRPYSVPYALAWTAFGMVLLDPGSIFLPGFQLSFMSLLGIVYLSPLLLERFGVKPDGAAEFSGGFRENSALTIAAQLAVAPIALNAFGGISITSFLANALILPVMPMTMFFGFLLIACGTVAPPLGFLAGLFAHILLAYEIAVIRFFAFFALPLSGSFPAMGIALYYLFLAGLIRRYRARHAQDHFTG